MFKSGKVLNLCSPLFFCIIGYTGNNECTYVNRMYFLFTMAQEPQWAKASSLSRIHDQTQLHKPHSVGVLWMSDQANAETSP